MWFIKVRQRVLKLLSEIYKREESHFFALNFILILFVNLSLMGNFVSSPQDLLNVEILLQILLYFCFILIKYSIILAKKKWTCILYFLGILSMNGYIFLALHQKNMEQMEIFRYFLSILIYSRIFWTLSILVILVVKLFNNICFAMILVCFSY